MAKRYYSIVGMVVGTIIVVLGILTLSGVLGENTSTASSSSYLYDSGYASFGADFYSYVTNNAGEAASAARTIAANQNVIYGFLKLAFGILMIAFGLFMNCFFGVKLTEAKAEGCISNNSPSSDNRVPEQEEQSNSSEAETAVAEEMTETPVSPSNDVSIEKQSFLEEIEPAYSMVSIWNIWRKYNLGNAFPEANDFIREKKDQEQINGQSEDFQESKNTIVKMLQA